jgi:hypothetical protein
VSNLEAESPVYALTVYSTEPLICWPQRVPRLAKTHARPLRIFCIVEVWVDNLDLRVRAMSELMYRQWSSGCRPLRSLAAIEFPIGGPRELRIVAG